MQIILAKDAKKHFKHLPESEQSKVRKKLLTLIHNPTIGKKLSGELKGLRSLRVWPYRIIYKLPRTENPRFSSSSLQEQQKTQSLMPTDLSAEDCNRSIHPCTKSAGFSASDYKINTVERRIEVSNIIHRQGAYD